MRKKIFLNQESLKQCEGKLFYRLSKEKATNSLCFLHSETKSR